MEMMSLMKMDFKCTTFSYSPDLGVIYKEKISPQKCVGVCPPSFLYKSAIVKN